MTIAKEWFVPACCNQVPENHQHDCFNTSSAMVHSMFEFFFEHEVKDVAWAPFSSTLFAAISGNAIVSVFDLAIDKIEAIGMFTCYTPKQNVKLTKLAFHPVKPVLIVGDNRGSVIIFKLSPNLRSSSKAMETIDRTKFVAGEIEKMDKLLFTARMQ
ncbi:dynein intermediate chain 1, axonemal [Trichonephila clavipes]|nr:dynein intermediate chain 1, axonemal [Trichonephila clavipes]